jgi:hypothetical protein
MPELTVSFNLTPPAPEAATAEFVWTFSLRFNADETPHGKPGEPKFFTRKTTGGPVTVRSAMVAGAPLTALLNDLTIVGTNQTTRRSKRF